MDARLIADIGILLTINLVACAPPVEPLTIQVPSAHVSNEDIFGNTSQEPKFPGSKHALGEFVEKNLIYPEAARKANVTGRVFTTFVIGTDGRITDIQVLKGLGFGCDEEAIRIIRAMPRWTPGRQSGRVVRVKFQMPFSFGVAARY